MTDKNAKSAASPDDSSDKEKDKKVEDEVKIVEDVKEKDVKE